MRKLSYILVLLIATATPVYAEELLVAVASNFQRTLQELAAAFEQDSGHKISISGGSTGRHFAQIISGAPFDIFLAADEARPRLLDQQGHVAAAGRFDYATGRLALWSKLQSLPENIPAWLAGPEVTTVAIANPRLAPYGAAASQVLEQLGLSEKLRGKIVMGENIGQSYQFVASGNATAGFVALAQLEARAHVAGSYWLVPAELHLPIRQQGVILRDSQAARDFVDFLQSATAAGILKANGYELPNQTKP